MYPGRRTCTVTALGTPLMLVLTHENLGAILGAKMADLQEAAEGTVGAITNPKLVVTSSQ